METDKSEDVQSASWRARIANDGIRVYSSFAGRLKTQEEPMFQFESKGRPKKKKKMSQFEGRQSGRIPSHLGRFSLLF